MTSTGTTPGTVERLHVDHGMTKRLGHWTSANQFQVKARSGALVIDLRSPRIQGDVEIRLDLHRSMVKILLAAGDQVDHWDLSWTGKGRIKLDVGGPCDSAGGSAGTCADLPVYFAPVHSLWERHEPECQWPYLGIPPKGTEIRCHEISVGHSDELNDRPRAILGFGKPCEVFTGLMIQKAGLPSA